MKILLVDDEVEFVSTLAERLNMRGFEADWCSSAEEAQKLAARKPYDLAILDVKMPAVGGIELKRRLQKLNGDMQFIFITGHGSQEDFSVGSEEAACYLGKPVSIDVLMDAINNLLGDRD
jgi:DNA-binding response OmpR family regulator